MNKCEHIIGLWLDYENTYNITLKKLKEEIKDWEEADRYYYGNIYNGIECPYKLEDYFDRRKNVDLERYNFCPICGEKIDWKSLKEE